MVGYDVMSQRIDPSYLIHHLPNTHVAAPPPKRSRENNTYGAD